MENEFDLDLDKIEEDQEKKLKVKNRFEQLSEKVILTSKEKEEAVSKAVAAEEAKINAEKERDFFKEFSANVGKYPQASAHQDKILEKVRSGYTTEDAIVSTLAREGQLTPITQSPQGDIVGGSAPNQIGDVKSKTASEMSTDEKLAQLIEAEKRGDISM